MKPFELKIHLSLSFWNPFPCTISCKRTGRHFKYARKLYPEPNTVTEIKINGWRDGIIDTLLPSIANFENVEILWLSDHGICELPKEIAELKKLRELSLAGNRLTTLPDEIFEMKKLNEVILLDNRFTEEEKKRIKKRFSEALPRTKLLI